MVALLTNMIPIEYKDIKENLYLINETGQVWSNYKKDFLKPTKDKDGYLRLSLSNGSREKGITTVGVATLVAYHFIGKPPANLIDPTVNHIDWNILNNHYLNLEWIERAKNSSIRKNRGEGIQNHEAKLEEKQVYEICFLLTQTNFSYQEIANKFKVKPSTISNIKNKKNWKNISKNFDFSCRKIIRGADGKFRSINTNLLREVDNKNGN